MKRRRFKKLKLIGLVVVTIASVKYIKSKHQEIDTTPVKYEVAQTIAPLENEIDVNNIDETTDLLSDNIIIGDMETPQEKKARLKFEKARLEEAKREQEMERRYMKTPEPTPAPVYEDTTPVSYNLSALQRYAHNLVINKYEWSETDFNNLVKLWNRESGWNPNSHNSSSGAHGIPQALPASKMASEGDDYYTNGRTQIRWGLKYIKGRYGTPSAAWGHFCSRNWY